MNDNIESHLAKINWFSHCGKNQELGFEYHQIDNIEEAVLKSQEVSWENKVLDEGEDFRIEIKNKNIEDYKNWNKLAETARNFINENLHSIWLVYAGNNKLGKEFIESLDWDVIHFILIGKFYQYSDTPVFFQNLLKIYESGKFPCGWDENDGQFYVY